MNDRGGQVLKTGKIGRVNCLRQQIMMPGEVIDLKMAGNCRLESLRERDSLRINAHLAVFMTPLRWLFPSWPQYVREGPDTGVSIPMLTENDLSRYGLGADQNNITFQQYWRDACLKIYNEWYKWPESADISFWAGDGPKAVPLQRMWNRARDQVTPDDATDYEVASVNEFDVRTLAETQAKFRSAIERDVLSYNRWMELCKEMFGEAGSREVDQIPIMIDQTDLGVNPREIPATDGASLGEWQSVFDFMIDHDVGSIVAPEHCIVSTMLVIRFAPLTETRHPLATDRLSWAEQVGDVEILGATMPQMAQARDFFANGDITDFGYMPSGWQWRGGHDVIGTRIDQRDSFPYYALPASVAEARDATRVNPAFRSNALGDYTVDVWFHEASKSLLNSSLESYYSGMQGEKDRSEFPKQGKML